MSAVLDAVFRRHDGRRKNKGRSGASNNNKHQTATTLPPLLLCAMSDTHKRKQDNKNTKAMKQQQGQGQAATGLVGGANDSVCGTFGGDLLSMLCCVV